MRALLMLVVLIALYGCGQPTSSAPEQGGKDTEEKKLESTPKPEPTGIQASSEFNQWNCRAETYVTEENMSEAREPPLV